MRYMVTNKRNDVAFFVGTFQQCNDWITKTGTRGAVEIKEISND